MQAIEMNDREKILNKKAVYEPSSSQRCHQMVCNRRWTIAILVTVGLFILLIAIIAAFARPGSYLCQTLNGGEEGEESEKVMSPQTTPAPVKDYISTDGRPFPWKHIRLPRSVLPDSYEIFLHPNISSSSLSGHVRIHCSVVTATDFVVFHVKDLNVTSVKVLRGEVEVDVVDTMRYKANEQKYVKLKQRLAGDSKIFIVVEFKGSLSEKLSGFYKSTYTTNSGETREIATTHFEPTEARSAFPCFDEPDMKANFSLTIIRESRHITLFNMPLKSTTPYKGDLLKDEYQMSVKMSTYLVAFVVCDFKNITAYTKKKVMVRVFAPADQIEQASYALHIATAVLDYYSDFFMLPYPLPKQDMIAIPDFNAGAMENWGLITYRMTSILYDPAKTSPSSKQWICRTVAHELAHQWFGNIVTMKWWDDLWLNEGFASYVEYLGGNFADPAFKMEEQFVIDTQQPALAKDAYTSSHPIHSTVTDPAQINEIFDSISYSKGASLIAMLRGFLGNDAFKAGLHKYLTVHSYGNARTDDLWKSLQEESNMPPSMTVKDVMDTWTLQMGYPVITVRHKPGTQHLLLTQTRFLLTNNSHGSEEENAHLKSPFGYVWKIPITYKTKSNPEKKLVWLKDKDMTLPVTLGSGDWIKFNLDSKGYYRVNYEESLWREIISHLKLNSTDFSVQDRAGLLDDAFYLTRAGLLSYDILFELLGYLSKETEYVPLSTALKGYGFITNRMYVTETFPKLKNYMFKLISQRLSSLGWEKQSQPLDEYLQKILVGFALSAKDKQYVEKAKELFGSLNSVPKNLRSLVCDTAVKYGDEEVWQSVFHTYTTSTSPSEQRLMRYCLTASREPRRIQLFLKESFNDMIVRSQDTTDVISGFASSSVGQVFAWRFIQQNWDELYRRYGLDAFTLGHLLVNVVASLNTQFDHDEVERFFQDRKLGSAGMSLKQSLEMVQSNIAWIARSQDTITRWFDAHATQP